MKTMKIGSAMKTIDLREEKIQKIMTKIRNQIERALDGWASVNEDILLEIEDDIRNI